MMRRKYRYVFLNLIITMFISLCTTGCCECLKKFLGWDVDSKYNNSGTKEGNEIKGEKHSEIRGKEGKRGKEEEERIRKEKKEKERKKDKKEKNGKQEDIKEGKQEDKEKDKEEDPLIEKRKEYFENTPIIKKQYNRCDKTQDLTKYKIDNDKINDDKLKDVNEEVNKVVNEEDRIFIQSDTEGKVFNIISALQIAGIIDINKEIIVYYNFYNGKFEKNKNENSIELKLFKVNKDFKGTYIHLGDIVDRCNGEYQCLKSLLLILYIKQELGDKVKLICGNHELMYSGAQPLCACIDGYPFADGEKRINFITRLICLTAISKGQIQYLDEIEIGDTVYILTHKVLYQDDIKQIKDFLKESMKEEKELDNYGTSDLIKVVNDNFKKCFCGIFDNYKKDEKYVDEIIEKTSMFEHVNGQIVIGDRVGRRGYLSCLKNQICGHDHHEIGECYIENMNILFVDNFSFDLETSSKPMVNIHFFDKNKELSKHKAFNIINDEGKLEIKIVDNFC